MHFATGGYESIASTQINDIRQDGKGDFVCHSNWSVETGQGARFADVFDLRSHLVIVDRTGG